jgi:hypothetical protein
MAYSRRTIRISLLRMLALAGATSLVHCSSGGGGSAGDAGPQTSDAPATDGTAGDAQPSTDSPSDAGHSSSDGSAIDGSSSQTDATLDGAEDGFPASSDGSLDVAEAATDGAGSGQLQDATLDSGSSDSGTFDSGPSDAPSGDAAEGGTPAARACASSPAGSPDGGGTDGGKVPLMDLGHVTPIASLFQSGDRVLAGEVVNANIPSAPWILWDTSKGTPLARGITEGVVGLAGSMFAVQTNPTALDAGATQLELRDVSDGHLTGTVIIGSDVQFGLASNGSYVWGAGPTSLNAWSSTGTGLLSRSGNYSAAKIFATPTQINVALGPAGSSIIEHVAMPGGASTQSSTFSGTFDTWFIDGSHFLTNTGATVWIYDPSANQSEITTLSTGSTFGGQGTHFWTYPPFSSSGSLNIYSIGGGMTPAAQYSVGVDTTIIASGASIGLLPYGEANVQVISVSSPTTASPVQVPSAYNQAFAADPAGHWSVGNRVGVLSYQGTVEDSSASGLLGCGQPFSVAGSDAGTAAVTTASGSILVVDTASRTVTQPISNFASAHVELSADGKTLAATDGAYANQYLPWFDLNIYSLPSGTVVNAWPSDAGYAWQWDFRLARGGTRIGYAVGDCVSGSSCARHVTDLTGATDVLDDTGYAPTPRVSPSGSYIAMTDIERPSTSSTTQLYQGSTLVTAVSGYAVGWIDDSHVLLQYYKYNSTYGLTQYDHSVVYTNQGVVAYSPTLPEIKSFDTISATKIFSHTDSNIYDVTTGNLVWSGGVPAGGAAAGPYAVYVSGSGVFLTAY